MVLNLNIDPMSAEEKLVMAIGMVMTAPNETVSNEWAECAAKFAKSVPNSNSEHIRQAAIVKADEIRLACLWSVMQAPTNPKEALTMALYQAITAPSDERAAKAIALAEGFASGMTEAVILACKAAAREMAGIEEGCQAFERMAQKVIDACNIIAAAAATTPAGDQHLERTGNSITSPFGIYDLVTKADVLAKMVFAIEKRVAKVSITQSVELKEAIEYMTVGLPSWEGVTRDSVQISVLAILVKDMNTPTSPAFTLAAEQAAGHAINRSMSR